jgi:hypothetical protein
MTLDQHYKLSSKKPDKGPQNANFSSLLILLSQKVAIFGIENQVVSEIHTSAWGS